MSCPSFKKLPRLQILAKVSFIGGVLLLMVAMLILPASLQAATKSIVETGPYSPNQEVTVQIDFTKPTVSVSASAELVVVVDTSGSLSSTINTMKSKLITFVNNTLASYPGAVRVGIAKIGNGTAGFDSDPSNDAKHAENAKMFATGTTTAYSNGTVGYDKVATITTSADYARLVAAINAIAVEPADNPNSPDGANSYTSDIGPGLNRAKGMFNSDATSKFVILITDGMANKGYCPVDATGAPAVTFPAGTLMQVVPGGTDWTGNKFVQTEFRTEDPIFPPSYPFTNGEPGVCKPYITGVHAATGWRAQQFTPDIATRYGAANIHSTNIDDNALKKVIDEVAMNSATIDDTLSSSVFSNVTSWVGLYNCDTGSIGTQYTGNTWLPSGNDALIIVPKVNLDRATRFCVRFKALIDPSAPGGSQSINTTGNVITYKNGKGGIITTDPIGSGSMSIVSDADLSPSGFTLTDASGTPKTTFLVGQPIYVKTLVRNTGDDASASGAVTRFYRNEVNALPINASNTPELWLTHGVFAGGSSFDYNSYPGGLKEANFNSTSGLKYWTVATPGTYYARAFVNYQGSSGSVYESDYSDNQSRVTYTVTAAPTLHFSSTVPSTNLVSPGTTINPSASITYTPTQADWTTQNAHVTVGVIGIVAATSTCASYTATVFNNTAPGGSGLTVTMSNGLSSISASPTSNPSPVLTIQASLAAPGASYTVCIGVTSGQSADVDKIALPLTVTPFSAWIQMGNYDTGNVFNGFSTLASGDVHSNADTTLGLPASAYFFKQPLAGVVSAHSSLSALSSQLAQQSGRNWPVGSYSVVTTPSYNQLYTNSPVVANNQINAGSPSDTATTAACTQSISQGKALAYKSASDVTIASGHPIAFNAGCNGADLIYFIDGNLTVNAPITDTSAAGTITFIVNGNITVASSVGRLDGMYLFAGAFSDGVSATQLNIYGSLIGLASSTPGATTGSFATSGVSGFQRDLGGNNSTQPAEVIYYQPKYLQRVKDYLGQSTFTWTE